MNIKSQAKEFATLAHQGQVRKAEPDLPYIIHPIGVAEMLESYGYDDHVVAAAYLHDVVEDTKYTLEDIQNKFGTDIAALIDSVSEKDKTLSWEDRKQRVIDEIKTKPLRNKLIACGDKINNIEALTSLLKENGMKAFSSFKRSYDKQLWYYKSIYQSLIYNEDEETPLFERLKNDIVLFEQEIEKQTKLENIS